MGNCCSYPSEDSDDEEESARPRRLRGMSLDRPDPEVLFAERADAITLRNQKESPFLRLPPEIRNAIYVLVLGHHRDIHCKKIRTSGPGDGYYSNECRIVSTYDLMSITRTCRQVHAESALIYFNINYVGVIVGHRPVLFRLDLLYKLTKEQRMSIRHWWRGREYSYTPGLCEPFDLLPGLQTVTIVLRHTNKTMKRDAEEARLRDLALSSLGREVRILFVYEKDTFPVQYVTSAE